MTTLHYTVIAISLILGSLFLALKGEAPTTNELTIEKANDLQTENTDEFAYQIADEDFVRGEQLIAQLEKSDLTEEEIDDLLFMREEEKLARDVYLALSRKWGIQAFSNIAESEQTHTDAVLNLLERYNIPDPASPEEGIFSNDSLQRLYNDLLVEGSISRVAALTVGARIEDLDIRDLAEAITRTDNQDIQTVYSNLRRASENHLRAFNKQLVRETGENYVPEFISVDEFETIISATSGQSMNGSKNGGGKGGNR
jgi:hypothetical protein